MCSAPKKSRNLGEDFFMPRVLIAPSVLSCDFGRLADEVAALEAAGADLIHVDVMDGHFVPNLTLGPPIVEAIRRNTRLPLDVHLMMLAPERWLKPFADAGADILHVHPEACAHLHRVVENIRQLGKQAAVALNPATPLSVLEYVLPELSMVLVMSVNPGFGGQAFLSLALPKIAALARMLDERGLSEQVRISVDGGIKLDNAAPVVRSGASVLVSGSGILGTPNYAETIRHMRTLCDPPSSST